MPKSIVVDPREVRAAGTLSFTDIPLNAYVPNAKKEIAKHGKETLVRMYRDMAVIREFETMLNTIKTKGAYQGIAYDHLGPAHLSIGQESAVVGQCLPLGIEDFIFGSHRSHGEIIAKCLSAVAKLPEKQLSSIMEGYMGGAAYGVVAKAAAAGASVKDLAIDFVLYGTLAEIFGRANGFNRGLGGSMHAFFAPFGSMPNNAIVGGSGDISVGAALYKRINRKPGIVIGNIGDGSSACGPVWEAMMVAAMDQYRTLWPKDVGGAPPILFNFFNNFYGMGGQTLGETMGFKVLARIGAGVNPEQMHAERVDGYNPLAVADAIERKKKILLEGKGPVLLDVVTYRYSGHSPSDASSYRTKEEVAMWQEMDCIKSFGEYLVENKVAAASDLEAIQAGISERMKKITGLAVSLDISPAPRRAGHRARSHRRPDVLQRQRGEAGRQEARDAPARGRRTRASSPTRRSRARASAQTASRFPSRRSSRCATRSSRPCCTASRSTRPWRPGARRTGTGAAPSPSTGD